MDGSYLKIVFNLLKVSKFYNESETIDIAKGKYKYPENWSEVVNMYKRNKLIKKNANKQND